MIKKALGITNLRFTTDEENISFPWFEEVKPEEALAYTKFISAICEMSKKQKMVINPEQAEIVRYIFPQTLAGVGTHDIAKDLAAKGVPTKKGGKWTGHMVNGIIRNEKYMGDCLFQKTYTDSSYKRHTNLGELDQYYVENHHEAIISKEEYEAANAVVDRRRQEKGIDTDSGKYQNRYPCAV